MEYSAIFLFLAACCAADDPCSSGTYSVFPIYFGGRSKRCTENLPVCDRYLQQGWYLIPNATILNHCPREGSCSTNYPAWMNGTLPDISDNIVTRAICIVQGDDCCSFSTNIQIKRCTTGFVYYLRGLPICNSVYCFDSGLPCLDSQATSVPDLNKSPTKDIFSSTRTNSYTSHTIRNKGIHVSTNGKPQDKTETSESSDSDRFGQKTIFFTDIDQVEHLVIAFICIVGILFVVTGLNLVILFTRCRSSKRDSGLTYPTNYVTLNIPDKQHVYAG